MLMQSFLLLIGYWKIPENLLPVRVVYFLYQQIHQVSLLLKYKNYNRKLWEVHVDRKVTKVQTHDTGIYSLYFVLTLFMTLFLLITSEPHANQ